MNKKLLTICLIAVLTLSVVCFASCVHDTSASDRLRQINAAFLHEYSTVELNVTTDIDGVELKANYVMTTSNGSTNIAYEVDRLNGFDANGATPSEFITTIKGNATFNGSAITSVDGDEGVYNVPLDAVEAKMTFRLSFFEDLKFTASEMSAKVINENGFLNDDEFEGRNMTVRVVMDQSDLSIIDIEYTLNDATVKMNYTFTR